MAKQFPKGFIFGTSTAACQIEDTKGSDWYGLRTKDGYFTDKTIEHEQHLVEDTDLIAQLGNAYRFNPNWAKLQTAPGKSLEPRVVDKYRNFMGRLKDKGVNLMFTLHHFANPNWFAGNGAWTASDAPEVFANYAGKAADEFGDLVDRWNTINEPITYAFNGYLFGFFPPHKKNPLAVAQVFRQQSKAHKLAYNALKSRRNQPVGVSNSTMNFQGESNLGKILASAADKFYFHLIPDKFLPADFIGISYYGRVPFSPGPVSELNAPGRLDKMGRKHDEMWEYYPEGLEEAIVRMGKRYGKPVIVTENGCCTENDALRVESIKEHLSAVHSAIQKGAKAQGYFHWSAFDNWEHNLGRRRFGLVHVDYDTNERSIKLSGELYSGIAKSGCLD